MFLPVRTDRRLETTPWVNYALIAANVLIFLATREQIEELGHFLYRASQLRIPVPRDALLERFPVFAYYLDPTAPQVYQFVSYQFLHADWMHLLGNMLFLYVFGNAVEDRLGKVGYLFFYLAGGVFAALGHALVETTPVLGASGAVAAVTGAFLALTPLTNVTIVYWFFFIGSFEVSGMLLILFQIGQNILFHLMGTGNVAYLAHLGGYAYGFIIGMALLLLRLMPREPYDMLALIEQRRRRAAFRRMTQRGYHPWEHAGPGNGPPTGEAPPVSDQERRLMEQRSAIAAALADHRLTDATRFYRELLALDPEQVMGQQQQLDLANQLMSEGRYDHAATAYELFLKQYAAYPQREQVQLILGLIYARYLQQPDRARELLTAARERLHGSDRDLAQQVLGELR